MSKTWQELFKLKLYNVYATVFQLSKYDNQQLKEKADVMVQFISDIRKRDMEALIRIAESKEIIDDGTYYSTEYKNGYNDSLENLQGHIKNYYENN